MKLLSNAERAMGRAGSLFRGLLNWEQDPRVISTSESYFDLSQPARVTHIKYFGGKKIAYMFRVLHTLRPRI